MDLADNLQKHYQRPPTTLRDLNGISKEKREKEKQLRRQRHTLRFSGCNLSRNFTSQFEKIAIIEIAEEEEKKLANQNVTTPSVVEPEIVPEQPQFRILVSAPPFVLHTPRIHPSTDQSPTKMLLEIMAINPRLFHFNTRTGRRTPWHRLQRTPARIYDGARGTQRKPRPGNPWLNH